MQTPSIATTSPFHEGEIAIQSRLGVHEQVAAKGSALIRDFLTEQQRAFFAQLPFVVIGTEDEQHQPWVSVLANPPGFIQSPHPQVLTVMTQLPGFSPLHNTLEPGKPIAFLGIEPHTRRRNRANGVVRSVGNEGFSVQVHQSFGNCPKYIQPRKPIFMGGAHPPTGLAYHSDQLDATTRALIMNADTFFIATSYPDGASTNTGWHGADVSHRGGKPGFVQVDNSNTLTVPDFSGNHYFNTLGNIHLNPRTGLLFIHFESGDCLHLSTDAEILWDSTELSAFEGAERLLRFHIRETLLVKQSLPLRWE